MAGYIGKSQGVTQVDGYNRSEADAEFLNQTEGDARYVELAGDTMTGNLSVPARGLSVGSREQFNLTNLGDETNIDWNSVTRNSISYALGGAHTNAPLQNVNSLVVDLNTEGMGGSNNSGPDTRGVQLWFTDTRGSQDGGVQGRFAVRMKQGSTQHPWEKVLTTYSFRRNIVRQSGTFLTSSGTFQNIGVSLTVTPLSAASRFLVFTRFAGYWTPSGDARGRVLRDGIEVYINERVAGNATTQHESCTDIFLDHPNTTNQVTYVMQGAIVSGGTMDFGHAGNACQLMVMEFEG